MSKPRIIATIVASLMVTAVAGTTAFAQQPAGSGVAVIDLKYIFEYHDRFQATRQELMREVEQAENGVKAQQEELRKMVERLKEYRQGTQEFKQLEAEIAGRKADLDVHVKIQTKEFMEREAKIHLHTYQEVMDAVKYYAQRNNIALVLRFNGDKISMENPQKIVQELNKSVLYFNEGIDITPFILEDLNRSQRPAAAAGGAPVAPGVQGVRPPQRNATVPGNGFRPQ